MFLSSFHFAFSRALKKKITKLAQGALKMSLGAVMQVTQKAPFGRGNVDSYSINHLVFFCTYYDERY